MTLRIKRAHSQELRDEIYALRYRAYRSVNALPEHPTERFVDKYDEQPNHVLWALSLHDRIIGSIRATWYDPRADLTIPEIDGYRDDVRRAVPEGKRILSGNRFVVDPQLADGDSLYALLLLRHFMVTGHRHADWTLAAVRSNHLPFYRRVLRLQRVSEGREYPGLSSVMYLTACDFTANISSVYANHPTVRPRGYERMLLDDSYQDVWETGLPVET